MFLRILKFLAIGFVVILFAQCKLGKEHSQLSNEEILALCDTTEKGWPKYFMLDTIPTYTVPGGYKIDRSDYVFMFDNVSDSNTLLTSYLKEKKAKGEAKIEFPIKDSILGHIDLSDTVPTSVFRTFAEYNAVSGWAIPQSYIPIECPSKSDIEDLVNSILERNTLIYSGQIALSDSFDSFLFTQCDTTPNRYHMQVKIVRIVNMKDEAITSISDFFSIGEKDDTLSTSYIISIDEKNVIHSMIKTTPGEECDCCCYEPDSTIRYEEKFDYKFDDMGQLVVLRCPIDYYDEMNRRVEVRKKLREDSTVVLK